ncbi:HigA family addiction module antidote protein [Duganella sp. FT135W]|uniref:HigA family addiction module antidote protein n=1 Tax=Duganella flavida TaxID=2692175 RepID=A0A6L8K139_9BURK|nr:HigA family addiction module antitoxin [Duganella flavida]MYM21186.1 HigA family addiction module antidote protein [Duganella flavida]
MTRMYNPPHPGVVLKEYLGSLTVADVAAHIGVNHVILQRILDGAEGISADMAYRLSDALGTSPDVWAGIQLEYDLYQASGLERPKIKRLSPPTPDSIGGRRGLRSLGRT